MQDETLPIGKLSPELLKKILARAPILDKRVLSGPGIGIDCAIIDLGDKLIALKTDPITFAIDEIGWYVVQVCANDIVTTGALPRWFLATTLLPEKSTTVNLVNKISDQIYNTCASIDISVVGGHTEITVGLDRPILIGTMIGEVERDRLIMPGNAKPGDRILLTKTIPIEATAIMAREFPMRLGDRLNQLEIEEAANYLYSPGISVLNDAKLAVQAGTVHAMHDTTEGGLAAALWEMSEASGYGILFNPEKVQITDISRKVCNYFGLDPLSTIASGSLIMAVPSQDADAICHTLKNEKIACADIGSVQKEQTGVYFDQNGVLELYPRPLRDEIVKLFE